MSPEINQWSPIQTAPLSIYPPHGEPRDLASATKEMRRAALEKAVQGIELGAYDRRIIEWLSGLDVSTVAVVVSLLHRVKGR